MPGRVGAAVGAWSGSRTNERAGGLNRAGFPASFVPWSGHRTKGRRSAWIGRPVRPLVRLADRGSQTVSSARRLVRLADQQAGGTP